jgi:thiamine biosynthesis lipoprotein
MRVSTETWHLLDAMATAWARTGGRCDATVLSALVTAGYDRDLADLPPVPAGATTAPPTLSAPAAAPAVAVPGLAGMELDGDRARVRLPSGVRLDPGAVAKGFAADLVAAELLDGGAGGALVNVGGDLALVGEPVDAGGWTVELALADGPPLRWRLAEGAIATSSSRRRRWSVEGEIRHHLIDPATGQPVRHPPATVSVVAAQAWWAEASATAIAVGGADWGASWAPGQQVTGVVEIEDGTRRRLPGAERFLA